MEERRLLKQTTFKYQKYHVWRLLLFVNLGSVGRGMEEKFSSLPVFHKLSYHTYFSGTCKAGVGSYAFKGCLCEMIQAVAQFQCWDLFQKWPHWHLGICQHLHSYHYLKSEEAFLIMALPFKHQKKAVLAGWTMDISELSGVYVEVHSSAVSQPLTEVSFQDLCGYLCIGS